MKKLVIFGIGKIGDVAYHHFTTDSDYEVVGFTADSGYIPQNGTHAGLPVVAFDEVEKRFLPSGHALFVAVGYQQLNQLRAERFAQAKAKGYGTASYISSHNMHYARGQFGENCFIMAGEPLQPNVKVGDNVFIWTGAAIGHHSTVGDHCWITSNVTIGGHSALGDYSFVGLGATIGHEITIGERSFIGAGALVTKDAPAKTVFIAAETERFRLNSDQFLAMTKMK